MIALILGRIISMTTGVRYLPHDFILIYPPKQKLGGYQKGTERYFDISDMFTKYAHNSKFRGHQKTHHITYPHIFRI